MYNYYDPQIKAAPSGVPSPLGGLEVKPGRRDSISGLPPNSPLKERVQSFAEWPPSQVEQPLLFLLFLPCL